MAALPRAISDLVGVFERLPGIGPKSATRLAFYLLNTPTSFVEEISSDLLRLKSEIKITNATLTEQILRKNASNLAENGSRSA